MVYAISLSKGKTIDDSNDTNLIRDLIPCGVIVLSKGEIEDYIPDADVASITGKSLANVQTQCGAITKRSEAFRKLFGSGKPIYGRQISEFYVQAGSVPPDLERLIRRLSA